MVNGPGHYRRAEEHLDHALHTGNSDRKMEPVWLQYAQVHATLALVDHQRDVAEHIKAAEAADEREASRLLRYQRDAAVTEINTLRAAVNALLDGDPEQDADHIEELRMVRDRAVGGSA